LDHSVGTLETAQLSAWWYCAWLQVRW